MSNFGALDMALDDVISQNRKQRKSTNNKQPANRRGNSRGGIDKNRAPVKRSSPYNAGSRPSRNNNAPAPKKQTVGNSLVVSNLHFNVTEKDLYDLFGQIGPVKRAFLHIGPNGRSAGIADVVFQNSNDAERARTTYNNVELDNRPMRIVSASLTTAVAAVSSKPSNVRRNTNLRGPNNRNSGRSNGRPSGGNRRRENRPKPNEQDLDADMDSYMGSAE